MTTPTAISAPGKVLLAGGYLVLDRAYTGLVLGLSARIHVVAQDASNAVSTETVEIVVRSPQFKKAQWRYRSVVNSTAEAIRVEQVQGTSSPVFRNPFVETALAYALAYISSVTGSGAIKPAVITILADKDYYSQPGDPSSSPATSSQEFLDFGVRLQDAHKTGLGSSAALVTAFTGAILSHYLPNYQFEISSPKGMAVLHNLAQAAHCAAQGKVGSGFDVAAAVYGSSIYRRFSPTILSILGEPSSDGFAWRLRQIVDDTHAEQKWDTMIDKSGAIIPSGMALIMCDVDCGSETVGMVKKVLEWKKQDPSGAKALWDELQSRNEALSKELRLGAPKELSGAISEIRKLIREMSQRSGVPIEPPEQTALLDAVTARVDHVYGGVVPGAGGYDAIVLLVKDDEKTISEVRSFLKEWSASKQSNVNLLSVRGEMQGVRREDDNLYGAWIK